MGKVLMRSEIRNVVFGCRI